MKTRKTRRFTASQVDDLLRAGQRCSNVCYNLAQDESLKEGHRESMKTAQRQWDKALMAGTK
jgi:hypothetical protein